MDFLLHIIEISDYNWKLYINMVYNILKKLNVISSMIYILIKINILNNINAFILNTNCYYLHFSIFTIFTNGLQLCIDYLSNWHE